MKCHECEHENTEGAWLCINCGAKLRRDEAEAEESSSSVQDPSRFEPSISENLRKLRERSVGDKPSSPARRRSPRGGPPRMEIPNLTGSSRMLGLPAAWWALAMVIFIIVAIVLGNLQ